MYIKINIKTNKTLTVPVLVYAHQIICDIYCKMPFDFGVAFGKDAQGFDVAAM